MVWALRVIPVPAAVLTRTAKRRWRVVWSVGARISWSSAKRKAPVGTATAHPRPKTAPSP